MHVLFLTPWYPNRFDAMSGLFVQKHAQAVARLAEVSVLYIHADASLKKMSLEIQSDGNLNEIRVYYPRSRSKIGRGLSYIRAYIKGIRAVFRRYGRPKVVHVSVLTRHAVAAYILKCFYGIPYVITEHWTRYMRGMFTGFWHRRITAFVVKRAEAVMPVSEALGKDMRTCGLNHPNYQVVRNVVDDFFFVSRENTATPQAVKRMVHVCCFAEDAKNNFGLLRALQKLMERRTDFVCYMVGSGPDWVATRDYARYLGLKDHVVFTGEVTPLQVHAHYAAADFSIFFSRYETASVVVAESLSAGCPVLCSDLDAIAEVMNEESGRRVGVEDEAALVMAADWMLSHAHTFSAAAMQQKARSLFSAEVVGGQFFAIYQAALRKS